MTTLYASIIRLHALQDGPLTKDAGQWANAAFYEILRQVDPELAGAIHQLNGRKPFTISTLYGLPTEDQKFGYIEAGQQGWLRVTTLGSQLFRVFIQRFLQGEARPEMQLGPVRFGVSEVLTTTGSHSWAGCLETERLVGHLQAETRLSLEFASPTGFNLGERGSGRPHYELFPHPALVFGSLATKWRQFIDPTLEVGWIEDLARQARVSDYRLHTQLLRWSGRVQKGFIGLCTYDLGEMTAAERAWMLALADFAFYAGVGGKATQGMGQCRRVH